MNNATPIQSFSDLHPNVKVPMPQYAVSIRNVLLEWPVQDLHAINQERRRYDAGLVEICTGRVGNYFVLYSIPRKVNVGARRWFGYSGSY